MKDNVSSYPIQKMLNYLHAHPQEYELLRYIIAGGLTTLLNFVIFTLFCIAVSPDGTVDGATMIQINLGQGLSWIIAVLFAFWINRRMVFQLRSGPVSEMMKELSQFILSRVVSGAVFEIGLINLLALLSVGNLVNKIISLAFVTVFNYVVSKFWIFSKKKHTQQPPENSSTP